jgi:glycolate dehydrogenase FAD-binding subunit
MITAQDQTYAELVAIVGASHVSADASVRAQFAAGGKTPEVVVYPSSAEEVAEALHYASTHGLAVIPVRNATKLVTGNPPRRYDVALSMKDMNRVWHYEPADLTISVEPGMKFGDFQNFVGKHGLWLPLNPTGGDRASLGGIFASNSTGSYRSHFGKPRDMALGMKIATAEGKVIKTGGRVVKNVAGYDFTKLMIGSFGTLGVMVEISLKLFPVVAERASFMLAAESLERGREIRRALQGSPIRPLRVALLDVSYLEFLKQAQDLKAPPGACQIWVEVGGSKRVVERCTLELKQIARRAGATFQEQKWDSTTESVWWRIDEPHVDVRANADDWLLKVSVPVSTVEEYLIRAKREFQRPEHFWTCWADPLGGIVHLWLHPYPDPAGIEQVVLRLRRLAEELSGSLVVEIAPATLAGKVDAWGATGDDFATMRKLKEAWDPKGVLSPGRFVGGT